MKWIKENKVKSAAILFGAVAAFFGMLNEAFEFFEDHVAKAQFTNRREIEKDTSLSYVLHVDKTNFDTDVKTGRAAK